MNNQNTLFNEKNAKYTWLYRYQRKKIKGFTSSNLGKKLAEEMTPHTNPKVVLNRNEEVLEAVKILTEGSGLSLGGISDITPQMTKLEKGMFLHPEELLKIADFLRCIRQLKKNQ